ncbi:ankyrin repeat domain-containing protein [Ideonella sp. 4Y16]|uniref:Ankyrin repeat domain-containing protein n=1 Tax=Ideonella alba TaxID=2824118 RepID=A0A941BGK5_9BURK|nr:ankyrin repeat domain-containing protein [Ideonella alba]MBQ0932192.1 ankyrin repeat domain-containing protein [Ideonella alba]MBQ0943697.1 ankyrin repeat domain-containing protein [Ideonella alba]
MSYRARLSSALVVPLMASATFSAVADSAGMPASEVLLSRCLDVERSALLPRLGVDPRLPDRTAVDTAARYLCEHAARSCTEAPTADACQLALSRYGLGSGAMVSPGGRSLFDAAYVGHSDRVATLLKDGADRNWTNVAGWTPLMIAAAERHGEIVAMLIAAGADPNRQNHLGRTALMFASSYGELDIVRQLVAAGANVDLVPGDGVGMTALMAAAARGHVEVVAVLLDAQATPSLKAKNGKTALDLAREGNHTRVVELLDR